MSQERVQERTDEHFVDDVTVPQIKETIVEAIQLAGAHSSTNRPT